MSPVNFANLGSASNLSLIVLYFNIYSPLFCCSAAASSLTLFDKNILDHCLIVHLSTEPGHLRILSNLKKEPILDLKLRLGEGSGAAVASLILKSALATHNGMSTFTNARVTNKIYP